MVGTIGTKVVDNIVHFVVKYCGYYILKTEYIIHLELEIFYKTAEYDFAECDFAEWNIKLHNTMTEVNNCLQIELRNAILNSKIAY